MNARSVTSQIAQDELPLSSVLSHQLFPGRASLYPHEAAAALSISVDHLCNLIESGQFRGAINIASSGNRRGRQFWRIPVSAFDAYVRENAS